MLVWPWKSFQPWYAASRYKLVPFLSGQLEKWQCSRSNEVIYTSLCLPYFLFQVLSLLRYPLQCPALLPFIIAATLPPLLSFLLLSVLFHWALYKLDNVAPSFTLLTIVWISLGAVVSAISSDCIVLVHTGHIVLLHSWYSIFIYMLTVIFWKC